MKIEIKTEVKIRIKIEKKTEIITLTINHIEKEIEEIQNQESFIKKLVNNLISPLFFQSKS
jgi:hypothetical protein